jgi:prevent-host-death family protein
MKSEVTISYFRANCSSLLEQVRKTRRPIRITCRGKVIAQILPVLSAVKDSNQRDWIGRMEGTAEIVGDIVSPILEPGD